jgi:nucleoside-diphosphate-sugar epimerase
MKKSAVVTGGAGFIGSHFVDKLVKEGWQVTVIDNLFSGFEKNLAQHKNNIKFLKGSITDKEIVSSAISEGDTVWHFAAMNSVPRSIELPVETNEVNVNGTLNILVAARENGAKRVIYSGSSSAYGDSNKEVKDESLPPHPISPYGLSKFTGEEYCRLFSSIYGLETATLRYFNVFGPRQNPSSPYSAVIPLFINGLLKDESIKIFGDGLQSRDFTYVDNVVEANFLAGTKEKIHYGSYNVACGDSISLLDILTKLSKITGYDFKVNYEPKRIGDIKTSRASIEKIGRNLGYKPVVSFDEGLIKALDWYKTNMDYFL